MSDTVQAGQARVLLEIPNCSVAGGAPLLLMRDGDGRHCIGQQVGLSVEPRGAWVEAQAAVDMALRILGGDPKAITHPRAMAGLATALLGIECWLEQARRNAARESGVGGDG